MASKMNTTAPATIHKLVETFEQNLNEYRTHKNETELRREFLDKFFTALGWDVDNLQGAREADKEVAHEFSVEIEGQQKKADYAFRIKRDSSITEKFDFLVEAKKPSVKIESSLDAAFQIRRYGWSAKLPINILTDFEHFAVYDCRVKPKYGEKAVLNRHTLIHYKEYLERWDEIVSLFSREAIRAGSLTDYVKSFEGKRGTADVDDDFLQEIERWRELLAKNIASNNEWIDLSGLNYAVQMIIDRIIFLRICEERSIEPENQLQDITNKENVYKELCFLFKRADTKYNSGLFHFSKEPGEASRADDLTLRLDIDDKTLKDIILYLYYPKSPYAFLYIPSDILGQVYERFLGKVIRLTEGHRAKVEEKPEVRKAGGVFYTPTFIVEYIVINTLGKLLIGLTPKEATRLKIVDPACGSGTFLLGAFEYLLAWHLKWYSENNPEKWIKNKAIVKVGDDDYRLTTSKKKEILLNNIYGVDIDPQAVEVTKLSLLLKVLENASGQLELGMERVLPDLGSNIKCGNSLVGEDYFSEFPEMISREERNRINVFNWQEAFPKVFAQGGFDAVIGNPPYVVLSEENFSKEILKYLGKYDVAKYKTDLFHLFIQKGIEILRTSGMLGFITPNTWFTLQFSSKLREYVLKHSAIEELVLFEHKVFEGANVHTGLTFLKKQSPNENHLVSIKKFSSQFRIEDLHNEPTTRIQQAKWLNSQGFEFEIRQTGETGEFLSRLLSSYPKLETVARASLGAQAYNSSKHTKEQIKNRVFHSQEKLSEEYLPELAGNDVGRYFIERRKGQWIKYGSWLHDYRPLDWLTGPRILIREISGKAPYRVCASYVEETYCNYKTILNVNPSAETEFSMKYLLGLLNSKLVSFIYPLVSNKLIAETFPRLSVRDVRQLPIRAINFNDPAEKSAHDKIVSLVESMLALHKSLASAQSPHEKERLEKQITSTDGAIDKLVYELYGLNEEEIKIVEGQ